MSTPSPAAVAAATSIVSRRVAVESLEGRRLLSGDTSTLFVGGQTVVESLLEGADNIPAELADAGAGGGIDTDGEFVRPLADGGFLVVSSSDDDESFDTTYRVTRFDAAGAIDGSYSPDGLSGTLGQSTTFEIDDLDDFRLDASGRAYAAVELRDDEGIENALGVIRLNADGTLDTTYGDAGVAAIGEDFDGFSSAFGLELAVADDGVAYLAGRYRDENSSDQEPVIVRLDAGGNVDDGFGDRTAVNPIGGQTVSFVSLGVDGLQADFSGLDVDTESLLVDGNTLYVVSDRDVSSAADLETGDFTFEEQAQIDAFDATTGAAVAGFGVGGRAIVPGTLAGGTVTIDDIEDAELGNGRVFLALGVEDADGEDAFGVVAVDAATGAIDASYGEAGLVVVDENQVSSGRDIDTRFAGVDAQGRVLFSGETYPSADTATSDVASVIRLTADGQLDTSFGTGGIARHELPSDAFTSDADDVAVLADGSVVLIGDTTRDPSEPGNTIDDDDLLVLKISRTDDSRVDFAHGVVTVTGTDGDETIVFTSDEQHNVTVSVNGQDGGTYADAGLLVAFGQGGADTITVVGDTSALVSGGAGDDTITTGGGNDVVLGKDGDDVIDSGAGHDLVGGNAGNDVLILGAGNDVALGGAGDDSIYGNDGHDLLKGNDGNDSIRGGAGNDWIFGHGGNDALFGDEGHDVIIGGAGDDSLTGGDGWDFLIGGPGNDTYSA